MSTGEFTTQELKDLRKNNKKVELGYLERYPNVPESMLTEKKLKNIDLVDYERSINADKVSSYPYIYMVGPTNRCNLKCALCPTKYDDTDMPKGFIADELYYALVDKISDYAVELWLYNWGESLLHPKIIEYIRYANNKKIFTNISTNFSLNLSDEKLYKLITSGLGLLHVDIDGLDQEVYEKYRIGGNLSLVFKNLKKAIAIKKELNLKFPIIETGFLVSKYNEKYSSEYEKLMYEWGVDRAITTRLQLSPKLSLDWMPSENSFRHENYLKESPIPQSCAELYNKMAINWDGRVASCCYTYDKESDFGKLTNKNSLHDVWNNEYFRSARNEFSSSKASLETICGQCKGRLGSNELTHLRDTFAIALRKDL